MQAFQIIEHLKMNWVQLIKLDVWINSSLRSRRLEVVAQEKTGAREGDTQVGLAFLLLARPFFLCAHYFQAPATQAKTTVELIS